MSTRNRLANTANEFQNIEKYKRILCVCSAGLLRSPTTAFVLSNPPYNYNTRAAGIVDDYALIIVDDVLIKWADEIVCMNQEQADILKGMTSKKIVVLDVPDHFEYRDPMLVKLIAESYEKKK